MCKIGTVFTAWLGFPSHSSSMLASLLTHIPVPHTSFAPPQKKNTSTVKKKEEEEIGLSVVCKLTAAVLLQWH